MIVEYICLIIQILLLLGTIFLSTGDSYLVVFKKIYNVYLFFEVAVQLLCIIANVIILFLFKEAMTYVLFIDIILIGIIKICFSIYAKNKYFQKLKKLLIEENLLERESIEIRKYLLEKYELIYSLKEIDKCLSLMKD